MGKKVNPIILRLGGVFNWQSRWFSTKDYKETVLEDYKLREALMKRLKTASIGRVEIERSINSLKIMLFVARPGMVIGRAGSGLEELKKFITQTLLDAKKTKSVKALPKIDIRVEAVKEPNLDAYIVGRNVADQLERRLPFKRVLNQNAERVMGAGAKGVKIALAGRIAGAEIGRREKINIGTVPLSTIRERVLYASVPALTKKGYIGVKVWINLGQE
jgi:small subunit ribosomal protein S3